MLHSSGCSDGWALWQLRGQDGLSNGAKCPKAAYPNGAVKINLVGEWAGWRPVPYSRYSRVKTYSFRYPFPGFCEPM